MTRGTRGHACTVAALMVHAAVPFYVMAASCALYGLMRVSAAV